MPRRKGGGIKNAEVKEPAPMGKPETQPILSSTPQMQMAENLENKKFRRGAFQDRLRWKMAHLRMPTTSTPKVEKIQNPREITKKDIDTAFGFDDSESATEGNYSTLISPIAHTSPNKVLPSVWKINPLTQRNVECEPTTTTKRKSPSKTDSKQKRTLRSSVLASTESVLVIDEVKPSESKSKSTRTNLKEPPAKPLEDLSNHSVEVGVPGISIEVIGSNKSDDTTLRVETESEATPPRRSLRRTRAGKNVAKPPVQRKAPEKRPKTTRQTRKKDKLMDNEQTQSTSAKVNPIAISKSKKSTKSSTKESQAVAKAVKVRNVQKRPLIFENTLEEDDGPSPFSQLLEKYNEEDDEETEADLHVDPKKIVRTYGSRKRVKFSEEKETEYDFVPRLETKLPSKTGKKSSSRSKRIKVEKQKQNNDDDLDEETKKWLDQKNKEFEDLLKVPLVIESSFSD